MVPINGGFPRHKRHPPNASALWDRTTGDSGVLPAGPLLPCPRVFRRRESARRPVFGGSRPGHRRRCAKWVFYSNPNSNKADIELKILGFCMYSIQDSPCDDLKTLRTVSLE